LAIKSDAGGPIAEPRLLTAGRNLSRIFSNGYPLGLSAPAFWLPKYEDFPRH